MVLSVAAGCSRSWIRGENKDAARKMGESASGHIRGEKKDAAWKMGESAFGQCCVGDETLNQDPSTGLLRHRALSAVTDLSCYPTICKTVFTLKVLHLLPVIGDGSEEAGK
jgi:hypothetical protein